MIKHHLINKEIEDFLIRTIIPDLAKGRSDWDINHTKSVVDKTKEIIENTTSRSIDSTAIITAAYAHDWGYSSLPSGLSRRQQKRQHMKEGAEKLKQLLNSEIFNPLTKEQKARAVHLVRIHDKVNKINSKDEVILFEADTLGMLDIEFVKPTYRGEIYLQFITDTIRIRFPKFSNQFSKKQFLRFIQQNIDFMESSDYISRRLSKRINPYLDTFLTTT